MMVFSLPLPQKFGDGHLGVSLKVFSARLKRLEQALDMEALRLRIGRAAHCRMTQHESNMEQIEAAPEYIYDQLLPNCVPTVRW